MKTLLFVLVCGLPNWTWSPQNGGGGLTLIQKDEEYPWSNIYWDNFDWLHLDDEQRIQD